MMPTVLQTLPAESITSEGFRPFGQVIFPTPDDQPFGPDNAQLQLQNGIPRFYIMQLVDQGLRFHHITRHQQCTQCLGALADKTWFIAVAPPGPAAQPDPSSIHAFRVPGNCFIKLEVGTWHSGPYFVPEAPEPGTDTPRTMSFYNLELSNTNVVDHDTCNLAKTFGPDCLTHLLKPLKLRYVFPPFEALVSGNQPLVWNLKSSIPKSGLATLPHELDREALLALAASADQVTSVHPVANIPN